MYRHNDNLFSVTMTAIQQWRTRWRGRVLLGAGAVVGLVLAAAGAFVHTTDSVGEGVLVRVNGKAISERDLSLALERRAGEGGASLTPEQRRETLDFLIDQELLVQRGVAIGLLESDRTIRKAIAAAVIDAVVAKALAEEPSEEELRAFYESHHAVFTTPARVRVQQIFCGGDGDPAQARARAEQVYASLTSGMSFADARRRYGNETPIALPETFVPIHVLRRQLGPTLADAVLALPAGEVSPPLPSAAGYHIFRMAELQTEQTRSYETVKPEVKAEFLRGRRDRALQQQLDRLRAEAVVVLSPKAPRPAMIARPEFGRTP